MPRRRPQRGTSEHPVTRIVEAGQVIPHDGTVVEGIASVDESALTGESAPVIREAGGERCTVIAGTVVVWGRIVVDVGGDGA